MQRALLDANFRQTDDGLRETENLLQVLADAWKEVSTPAPLAYSAAAAWQAPAADAPRVSQNWSA
jgi:flagellin-specific chaperone FliS